VVTVLLATTAGRNAARREAPALYRTGAVKARGANLASMFAAQLGRIKKGVSTEDEGGGGGGGGGGGDYGQKN